MDNRMQQDGLFATTTVDYARDNDLLQITPHPGYGRRNEAVASLFRSAFERVARPCRRSFRMVVSTGDNEPEETVAGAFNCSCAMALSSTRFIAVPDHVFDKWEEVGIDDYDQTCCSIVEQSQFPPTDDRLFWIGSAITNRWRGELLRLADAHNDLVEAVGMGWAEDAAESIHAPIGRFVSLPDHCKYRYLMDVEGYGYSGRLKMLLFSGRPVFVQQRNSVEYWHAGIHPYEHYIPVRNDLSDLIEQILWARSHPAECDRIARNAQAFAQRYLTRAAAIEYLLNVISKIERG